MSWNGVARLSFLRSFPPFPFAHIGRVSKHIPHSTSSPNPSRPFEPAFLSVNRSSIFFVMGRDSHSIQSFCNLDGAHSFFNTPLEHQVNYVGLSRVNFQLLSIMVKSIAIGDNASRVFASLDRFQQTILGSF